MQLVSEDVYNGWIVEEGLKDPLSLEKLEIKFLNVHLSRNKKSGGLIYHVYGVAMNGSEVEKLTKLLHNKWHYAKFFHRDEVIMVFPKVICVVNLKTKAGLKEAVEIAKKLEIGQEHIDNIVVPSLNAYG